MEILKLFFEAFKEWVRDRAQSLAASMAYYELICIGPIVGFMLFIIGKFLGQARLQEDVIPVLKNTFTPQLTKVIVLLLSSEKEISWKEFSTISFVSGLLLLWAGKEYFGLVKQIILTSWNQRRYTYGIKAFFKRAIVTLKISIVSVFLVVLFISIRALLPHPAIEEGMKAGEAQFSFVNKLGQWFVLFTLLCALRIFYFTFIPPVKVNWRYTIPGAIIGAVLYIVGREIMEAHFRQRPDANVAESIIMVLIWFYYASLTLVYSAEFTKLYVAKKQNIDLKSLKFD